MITKMPLCFYLFSCFHPEIAILVVTNVVKFVIQKSFLCLTFGFSVFYASLVMISLLK